MEDSKLPQLLLIWMAALLFIAAVRWRRKEGGAGLTLAYLLNLWMIHWLAPALYLIPGYRNNDPRIVEAGFEQSLYAVLAFAVGAVAVTPFIVSVRALPRPVVHTPDANLPRAYIGIGVAAYLALSMV